MGRAIRLSPEKSVGTIVTPVLVPADADADTTLEKSIFEPARSVVRALRDHDETLADQLDAVRRRLGREGRLTADDLPDRLVLDLPEVLVGSAFADALVTQIVDHTTASWEENFAAVEAYIKREGHAQVPSTYEIEGRQLGRGAPPSARPTARGRWLRNAAPVWQRCRAGCGTPGSARPSGQWDAVAPCLPTNP